MVWAGLRVLLVWLLFMPLLVACGYAPGHTLEQTSEAGTLEAPVVELSQWEYRWGDLPRDASGRVEEPANESPWQRLRLPAYPRSRPEGDVGHYLWMRARLPDTQWRDPALSIDQTLLALEVYLEGQRIHAFGDLEQGHNTGRGLPWHLVTLPRDSAGKWVYLRVRSDYSLIGVQGRVHLGDRGALLSRVVQKDVPALLTASTVLLIGLLALLAAAFGRGDRPLSLAFAALALGTGAYTLRYTRIKDVLLDAPELWFDVWLLAHPLMLLGGLGFVWRLFFKSKTGAVPPEPSRWEPFLRRLWWVELCVLACFLAVSYTVGGLGPWTLLDNEQQNRVLGVLRLLHAINDLVVLVVVTQRALAGNREARWFAFGVSVLVLAGARDIAAALGWISFTSDTYVPWGVLTLIACGGGIVFLRYLEELRESARALAASVEQRAAMVRDLHDGIGGITTNIGLLTEVAKRTSEGPELERTLQTIGHLSREGLREIRSFMHSLDDEEATWVSLIAELRGQARQIGSSLLGDASEHSEIEVDASCAPELPPPPTLLRYHLSKIAREAMTNALKHGSGAPKLRFEVTAERLVFELENPISETAEPGAGALGVNRRRGSTNMLTRVNALGGDLETRLESTHFWLRVVVPLPMKYPDPGIE